MFTRPNSGYSGDDNYFAHVPNSDTIYFSALDTTLFEHFESIHHTNDADDDQQRTLNHYDYQIDYDTSSDSNSSNYYSSLHRPLLDNDENDFTSLRLNDIPRKMIQVLLLK